MAGTKRTPITEAEGVAGESSRDARPRSGRTYCEGASARRNGVDGAWEGAPGSVIATRLREVRIPPGYPEATLCLDPASRIQAYGRDTKGRLQILYHARVVTERQARKAADVLRICQEHARLVRTVRLDAIRGEPLALAAWILVETAARPGHDRYRALSGTHGASNLRCSHVAVHPDAAEVRVELRFPAKHGKPFAAVIQDPEVARALVAHHRRQCRGRGDRTLWGASVDADSLNVYLDGILPGLRAKNLRTWRANLHFLAAWIALGAVHPSDPEKRVIAAVRATADHLQNTPSVAREQYLLPELIEAVKTDARRVQRAYERAESASNALEAILLRRA